MIRKFKKLFLIKDLKIHAIDYRSIRKINFLLYFSILGILIFFIYGFVHLFVDRNIIMVFIDFFCGILLICNLIVFKITKRLNISSTVAFFVCMFLFTITTINGGYKNFGILWILIFPLFSYYLKGKTIGTIFVLNLLLILGVVFLLDQIGLINVPHSLTGFIYVLCVFIVITLMTYFYEDTMTKNEDIIKKQLYTDPLTGMPNRLQLLEDIKKSGDFKLILINVDGFKTINNLYGNKIGDLTLKELSDSLKQIYEEDKVYKVYKLNADEFAVLFERIKNTKKIKKIVQKIHRILAREFTISNLEIIINVTLGIAGSKGDILANSDMALRLAKEKRKDYVFFDKSMKIVEKYKNNLKWIKILKKAIAFDDIIPYYQPIINNKNGKIEKYECLVRLIKDDEVISPYSFLDISKKSRIYPHITKTMIMKSFETFKDKDYMFSINLSVEDIINKDTVDFIFNLLKDYKNSDKVVFELIESEYIEDNQQVSDFIHDIKTLGCRIAIDDFGTGYS
ncbi:MAG: EAL domain-containing protein, partial [Spirochaetes bacterium]|nr:EAL domain-containing protein [Spirochaetota bacterium]